MLIVWLLYGLTALVSALIGYTCLRRRSEYPNTSTGFRFGLAVTGPEAWIYANDICGRVSVIAGFIAFLVVPVILSCMAASMAWFLGVYFFLVILWLLAVALVPLYLVKREHHLGNL